MSACLWFFAGTAGAAVFRKAQMDEIACSAKKTQLFYYYLSTERDAKITNSKMKCGEKTLSIKIPGWVDSSVSQMLSKKAWRDPEEGEISEAALWQTAISIIYEFLDVTQKTFPPEIGGAGIAPGLLVKEYSDIRIRYQMSLDRLYRARLADSMEGRGRSLLAIFSLILREMESIADALSSTNAKSYAESASAVAVLSQDAFSLMFKTPRQHEPPMPTSRSEQVIQFVLKILGIILVFLGVRIFFVLNQLKTEQIMQDYATKVSRWTDDFSRQFLEVKVHYLVMLPLGLFALMGLLTFSLPAFFILTLIGLYSGLKMPGMVLNFLKNRRGKQVDGQLMDALILLSNSLKSGLDIVQGFEMVSKDLLPPISDEFGLVIKNYQLGMPFEKALGVMEERIASKMLAYMIRAIVLQRQMGGNLTKVFERILIDIREESKLEEKTKALTAQQRIQSIVVAIMPWILVSIMFLLQPQVMIRYYSSGLGILTLFFAVVWISIGMKIVSALGKIRV